MNGYGWRYNDVLIVHYSFYDEQLFKVLALPVRKVLVYHNVTPSSYFRDVGMHGIAQLCDASLDQLGATRDMFDAIVGDSQFNLLQMPEIGAAKRVAIPVFYQETLFSRPLADRRRFFDVRARSDLNLLFVGRFVPNKRHDKLVEVLAQVKRATGKKVMLHLAGKIWDSQYYLSIISAAADAGVLQDIQFYHDAPQDVVTTLFAAADAFVSMSEHEGFMVPVVEAFASGCPVVADPAAAVGETMGLAGLKVRDGRPDVAAGIVAMLALDKRLRHDVVARGAARALDFATDATFDRWLALLGSLVAIEEVVA